MHQSSSIGISGKQSPALHYVLSAVKNPRNGLYQTRQNMADCAQVGEKTPFRALLQDTGTAISSLGLKRGWHWQLVASVAQQQEVVNGKSEVTN